MRAQNNLTQVFRDRGDPRGDLSCVTSRRSRDHILVMCSVTGGGKKSEHTQTLGKGEIVRLNWGREFRLKMSISDCEAGSL